MKKIKSLFVALVASFGMLTTLAGGLGIYINDVEVGAGDPPKNCGWTLQKSNAITTDKFTGATDYEYTVVINRAGNYALTGSNTVNHLQFSVEADCMLALKDFTIDANPMLVIHNRSYIGPIEGLPQPDDFVPFYLYHYYSRRYNAFLISPGKEVSMVMEGRVNLQGSEGSQSGILVGKDASVTLSGKNAPVIGDFDIIGAGKVKTVASFTGKIRLSGGDIEIGGGEVIGRSIRIDEVSSRQSKKYGKYVEASKYSPQRDYEEMANCYPDDLDYTSRAISVPVNVLLAGGKFRGDAKKLTMTGGTLGDGNDRSGFRETGEYTMGWNYRESRIDELIIQDGVVDMSDKNMISASSIDISGGSGTLGGYVSSTNFTMRGGSYTVVGKESVADYVYYWEYGEVFAYDRIDITGGYLWARGGLYAANRTAIGGGTVYALGGSRGDAWGGGVRGNVTITGGEVHAEGWNTDRPVNGRYISAAIDGYVKITGGTVYANWETWDDPGCRGCAGIGGDDVEISGGTIYARGGGCATTDGSSQYSGAAIGGSHKSTAGGCSPRIKITGGEITAIGGAYSCAIGPAVGEVPFSEQSAECKKFGTTLTSIDNAKVKATGGVGCPAIYSAGGFLTTIRGGTVCARGGQTGMGYVLDAGAYRSDVGVGSPALIIAGGASYHNETDTGDVRSANGDPLYRVTVRNPSMANAVAKIDGLPYEYRNVVFDESGCLYLWLPGGQYAFTVNANTYTATVVDAGIEAVSGGPCSRVVTFDAQGGTVEGKKSIQKTYLHGSALGAMPTPVREGYEFLGWRWTSEEVHVGSSQKVTGDMNLSAHWRSKAEIAQESGGSHQGEVGCLFKTDFFSRSGHFADGGKERELWFPKGSAISLSELPVPVPDDANDMFYGWYDWEENRYLQDGDVLAYGHNFLAAFTEKSKTVVTFYRCVNVTPPNYEAGGKITVSWDTLGLDYISPGGWAGHRFKGWFSQPDGKGVQYVQDWNGSTHYVKTDDTPTVWYGYWQLISVDWTMNRYNCANVRDLGVELPAVQFRKTVTAENLPKGLKLVEDKATHAWYIEGVPTEARDIEKNYAVVRCKYKDGSPDKVMKVMLNVLPDAHAERTFEIGSICSVPAADFFGEPVDKDWKVSGLAANLKYATKDSTKWTDAAKVQHVEPALTIYGQPNKIGPMTVLGKKTVKSQVPGQSASYTEAYSVEVLVTPVGGSYDAKFTAYANELMDIFDATAALATAGDAKTTASGLPTGMKFTAKTLANNKDYGTTIPAGSLYGKPTKIGLFAVTLKDKDKNEGYILVRVADPAAPEVGAYFGTKKTKLMKAISAGDAEAEQNKPITLMVGATTSIPLSASAGAAVKASGLPAGLKLAQDKTTKLWAIEGAPSKAGTFLAKVTATLNKVATEVAYIFEVEPNAFAGEWRGHMVSRAEDDDWAKTLSGVIVSVAAGGATKVTLAEKGVSAAYSFKSFDWDDLNGNASVSFTTKATKTSPIARDVTLEIVDKGGWLAVTGRVRREGVDSDGIVEAYPVVKAAELTERGVLDGIEPSRVWSFAEDLSGEGLYAPYALLTSTLDAKKATVKIGGKLLSGMKTAVSNLPVVRVGDDPKALASYAFAPFTVYDKTSESTRLFSLSLDGSGWDVWYDEYDYELRGGEWIACDTAAYTASAAVSLGEFCTERLLLFCDFLDDGTEVFTIEKDAKGKLTAFDATGVKLAAVTAKVAKDGTVSFKLTSADKVFTYGFELVAVEGEGLTGFVTRSWKDGKKSLSAVGVVDAVGL